MIIYENTVPNFIKISKEPRKLAIEIKLNLLEKFGILVAENEARSWIMSLPQVANLIKTDNGDKRKVLIEFNIPTTKQRVDFIILGKDENNKPTAWLLELKQWSDITEIEWNEFRVGKYRDTHPSQQANDYTYRLLHEMGMYGKVDIKSSAFLHNLDNKKSPLFNKAYEEMIKKSFLYSKLTKDELAKKIDSHTIIRDGYQASKYFREANWKPSKVFKDIVNDEFIETKLVGTQKEIYEKIERFIKNKKHSNKMTFFISGDPGSGKTIVAFKLLMLIAKELKTPIQLMIPGQEVREAFKYELRKKSLSNWISGSKLWNGFQSAIIDEGHKAIGRDTGLVNYNYFFKSLNFSIIFIDDDQVINRKGITKNQIKKIALENNHIVYEYKIEENFRNAGERSLLDWIDYVFYKRKTKNRDFEYEQVKYINATNNYKLKCYESDDNFVKKYYQTFQKNQNTRITSLWHEQFYIGAADNDGNIPKTIPVGKHKFVWNPNQEWFKKISIEDKETYNKNVKQFVYLRRNFLTGNPKPEYMAYFNHIQGYEFDNIFVYIPKIFTLENNQLIFHRERLAKEVKSSQTWSPTSKSKELNGRDPLKLNKQYFLNRIKVMLTRGTKSTHIYAEDKALNNYIIKHIN